MSIEQTVVERAEEILGYRFGRPELLQRALTHASIADSRLESNERLEFLGDAVLGMIVCDHLFRRFPDLLEGELTKIKSTAVSRNICAQIATDLELDALLSLGKGMKTRSSLPSSLSAAVLEAVIGAMYLDSDMDRVRAFLMPHLEPIIDRAATSGHQQNFKSVLQHYAQRKLMDQPVYLLLDEKGPDHAKCFHVCVEIGAERFDGCWAASKKHAEQLAALKALEMMGLIEQLDDGHVVYMGDELERSNGAPINGD